MGDFFHGWRRKAGCVTLVMACILMGITVRSMFLVDNLTFTSGERFYQAHSFLGHFWFESQPAKGTRWPWKWNSYRLRHHEDTGRSWLDVYAVIRAGGFIQEMKIAYWPFVAMLTILSAYLLLIKPRKPNP